MTVVKIPPDGAAKRHRASQENAMASKEQLVVRTKNLRKKIDLAETIKSLREHPGWKALEMWYTTKWSFANIMNEFRNGTEQKYRDMMIQRETLTIVEETLNTWIKAGDQARAELDEEERSRNG